MIWRILFLFLLFGISACNSADHFDHAPPPPAPVSHTGGTTSVSATSTVPACNLNQQYQCTPPGGGYGVQFCKADRSGFQTCMPLYTATPIGTGGMTSTNVATPHTGGASYVAQTVVTKSYTGGAASVSQASSCIDNDHDGECASTGNPETTDCNDQDARMHHGNIEICGNGIDDNCNGKGDCTDPVCSSLSSCQIRVDMDGDGEYASTGDPATTDCNDQDARMHHGNAEICNNGIDDDCSGAGDCSDPVCMNTSFCP